jgi:hypothetical protein
MKLTGHKSEAVDLHYAMVCEAHLTEGLKKLAMRERSPFGGNLHSSWPKTSHYAGQHGGGARCENPEASGTIGPDLTLLFQSQSLPEESEARGKPIKPDRER